MLKTVLGGSAYRFEKVSESALLKAPRYHLMDKFKQLRKVYLAFIRAATIHMVKDTKEDETVYLCEIDGNDWWISKTVANLIIKRQSVAPLYKIESTSCLMRMGMANPPFRYVFWKGFKTPTKESFIIELVK